MGRYGRYGDDDDRYGYGYYRKKIKATGGIKAQSKRGSFGETWWGKRWVGTLESFDIGERLTRGRSYARSGQVLSIDIAKGEIKSKVQGSFPQPYKITIKLKEIDSAGWRKLTKALASQAIFAAKLMAGEMPQEIEQAFKDNSLSLFPEKLRDLETDCSCPDWSNPCKHIAAVYYLIGEEFDRDPFLLFKLRGLSREELIEAVGKAGGAAVQAAEPIPEILLPPEPLAVDAASFWQGGALPENLFGEVRTPPVNAALPKRLGNFPFWRGEENFSDAMNKLYERASAKGLEVF
ncbi:MAG: SWIM zinc finger family protein [Blastocatellia bacterium]